MELIDLVSELLYEHNCVIIPGFGGFVGNFKSTDFNDERLLASPNRKRVAFNQSLVENDGLLINALSKRKNISYDKALHEVEIFVKFLNDRLAKYKNYEFKHLGSLYQNKEDKLIFVAYDGTNFHKKSFGLGEVKVRRLSNAPEQKPVVVAAESKIVPLEPATKTRRFYIPQIAASLAIVSVFAIMIWQILHTNAKDQLAEDQASGITTEQTAGIIPDDSSQETITEAPADTIVIPFNDATVADEIDYTDVTDEVIEPKSPKSEEKESNQVVKPAENKSAPRTVKKVQKNSTPKTRPAKKNDTKTVKTTQPKKTVEPKSDISTIEEDKVASAIARDLKPFRETYHYVVVAKNADSKTVSKLSKRMQKRAYDVYEKEHEGNTYLCLDRFISRKNAKDFLYLVKKYDDRNAYIVSIEE